mgnify:CR=1 FL=1
MEFYKILQEIMKEKNLNIPDIARMCGLADGTVRSAISREQKSVSLDVAFKLSTGLGVSLERLNGMPEKPAKTAKAKYSEHEVSLIEAYRIADPKSKKIVETALEEYVSTRASTPPQKAG